MVYDVDHFYTNLTVSTVHYNYYLSACVCHYYSVISYGWWCSLHIHWCDWNVDCPDLLLTCLNFTTSGHAVLTYYIFF